MPIATARPGTAATLLVGLNDILRVTFIPERMRASVHSIIGELCAAVRADGQEPGRAG